MSEKHSISDLHAQAIQKEKMDFLECLASSINHEIANPLSIARGQCEAFLVSFKDGLYDGKSADELLKRTISILERVIIETDRITDITRRLTDFVKPGKEIKFEKINVTEEIDTVLAFISSEIQLCGVEITKHIASELPLFLADKKHAQQIFFNVIKNAVQAVGKTKKISVIAEKTQDYVKVSIIDSGPGINESDFKKIFLPFFTTKNTGTGLGLFITKQLIEKNKGKIEINSEIDKGVTVDLYFQAVTS